MSLELRWRYNGIPPLNMVLEFREHYKDEWQKVPVDRSAPLTDGEYEWHKRRQGDGVTIIR